MKSQNALKAKVILIVYLIATVALLFLGYSVQKPEIVKQEFPFAIIYSYQGETETISDVYVGEYVRTAKYLGDDSIAWYGYIKDRNRLESDFYRIGEMEGHSFSINLNIEPGYLMGDPGYADGEYCPTLVCHYFDGTNETEITDPAELEKLGFCLVNWEYPAPIENRFSYGGISLSSEAVIYTSVMAAVALLACLILIRSEKGIKRSKLEKLSVALNFLVAIVVFPFVFMVSVLSEIVADASAAQQLDYLAPALTIFSVGASVAMRRCGYGKHSLLLQLMGPAVCVMFLFI